MKRARWEAERDDREDGPAEQVMTGRVVRENAGPKTEDADLDRKHDETTRPHHSINSINTKASTFPHPHLQRSPL